MDSSAAVQTSPAVSKAVMGHSARAIVRPIRGTIAVAYGTNATRVRDAVPKLHQYTLPSRESVWLAYCNGS